MEQDTIDLLKELVAIDSQNPSLVPGAAGESQIAAYVADWAKGAGLTAEIMEETPGRPSVVVRSGPVAVPVPHGRCCCAGTWTPSGSAR
jgi:acetylornithine deacetylase